MESTRIPPPRTRVHLSPPLATLYQARPGLALEEALRDQRDGLLLKAVHDDLGAFVQQVRPHPTLPLCALFPRLAVSAPHDPSLLRRQV